MSALELVTPIGAALYGLIMGSAVTAIAWRVPRRLSWVRGRSACPSCQTPLGPLDLVPVLSFALARGHCRHCGAHISWRYPITEILSAAWAVLLLLKLGPVWALLPVSLWGFLLIALLWIDLEFKELPDAITLPGTLLGIAATLMTLGWAPGAQHALLGILAGSGTLWLLAWVWITFRRVEGMGGGDIKLAAMFGAVLGWQLALLTMFVAALAGSLWGGWLMLRRHGGMKSELPFGTLLAPAALLVFLWGGGWVSAYVRLLTGR